VEVVALAALEVLALAVLDELAGRDELAALVLLLAARALLEEVAVGCLVLSIMGSTSGALYQSSTTS